MLSGTFSARAYSFFDTLLWIACLNLLWIVFALLGLGILGAGPATASAQILVRKRSRGEAAPLLRGFVAGYFRNFVRANALALPLMGVSLALFLNWNWFAGAAGVLAEVMAALIFVLALVFAGIACHVFPMYARYQLPLAQYLLMSSRFAVRHLAGTVILLFVSAAVFFASSSLTSSNFGIALSATATFETEATVLADEPFLILADLVTFFELTVLTSAIDNFWPSGILFRV